MVGRARYAQPTMKLTYETGEHAGRTIALDGRRMVVGRGRDSDIVLHDDEQVSRRHATLEERPDGTLLVTDLGSTNGTFVNGRCITGAVDLLGGERVRFGETSFRIEDDESVAASPPQPLPVPLRPLPVPPRPQSASLIERIRLRRSVVRANVLAGTAFGIAVLVVGGVALLVLTGALTGGRGKDDEGSLSSEQIVIDVTPSTVDILSRQSGRRYASGSGWVLDAGQGLIVTNSHVINGGDSWAVKVGDEQREGKFVAAAPCDDQAVLKLSDTNGLKTMPLGDQHTVRAGQVVLAVGFPVNASARDNLTATGGVVSVPRTVYTGAFDVPDLPNVIQTDAAINPGNSGGPLVNFRSQLIGMDTAGLERAGGRTMQGQGYAIGVDRIKQVTSGLRRGRSMGYTGLGIDPVAPQQLAEAGLPTGLHTVEAVPGSPADKAGLGDGRDRTIVTIDGKRLDGSLPQYCKVVEGYRSGQRATFTVGWAAGRMRDLELRFL